MAAVHWTRRGAGEVDAVGIVLAAVARAVKHVLLLQPVRRATQMRAARKDHEQAAGIDHDPNAVGLQEILVDAGMKAGRRTDVENGVGLVERSREEKSQ